MIAFSVTAIRIETRRATSVVLGAAVLLAVIEAVQSWFEHRSDAIHDGLGYSLAAMMPAWLTMAALVPAVAWWCRRHPPKRALAIFAQASAAAAFPVVHLTLLALVGKVIGDHEPLMNRIGALLAYHYVFDVFAYVAIASLVLALGRRTQAPPAWRSRFVIRDGDTTRIVASEAIDWIEARNYYVRLHAGDQRFLLRESLSKVEAELDPAQFARVHRSAIVNLRRVDSVRRDGARRLVQLKNGVSVPASRGRWEEMKARI